jgi:ubiquinone/menaquinone biosynthesis C-methylase UbiE
MDYDQTQISASYDKARALEPETARMWRELLSADLDGTAISVAIDLGCGTGRFTEILAAELGAEVIGIDPSYKMIEQARHKPARREIRYQTGQAEAIPLPDGCADLVFISMVYHHFDSPADVARECHRVLRSAGVVCVRNGTRERDFPHRHFFPGLEPLIASGLPSEQEIERVFCAAGFICVVHRVVRQVIAPNWARFVEKSSLRADSFLARLSDEDFAEGMAALRSPGQALDRTATVTEEIDWFVFHRNEAGPPSS